MILIRCAMIVALILMARYDLQLNNTRLIGQGVLSTMSNKPSRGTSVKGTVQIIFVVLKCIGLISWSWGAVLIPCWIMLAWILLYVIGFIIYCFME